jgi:hypothetical protein
MFFGVGYASVTTMSVALVSTIIFAVRYYLGLGELADVFYGIFALVLLVWALRPNITADRGRSASWMAPVAKTPNALPAHENIRPVAEGATIQPIKRQAQAQEPQGNAGQTLIRMH